MINLLKLFSDTFDPQPGETALVLIDTPHGTWIDTPAWKQRRAMAQRWRAALSELGRRRGFQVLDLASFPATGSDNAQLPEHGLLGDAPVPLSSLAERATLLLALTQFSAAAPLIGWTRRFPRLRVASMPMVAPEMEETALAADYAQVARSCARLRDRLAGGDPAASSSALASALADVALLNAVKDNVASVLGAMGAPRQGPSPGSGPQTPFCDVFQASGQVPLIDDFEDGNSSVLPNDGRSGSWHAGSDQSGFLSTTDPPVPEVGGVDGAGSALHLSGGGFSGWGANLTVELRNGAFPYDASAYQGIKFWARGSGTRLKVIFMQQNLAPGHPCSTCDTASGECGLLYSTELAINDAWNKYTVDWTSLTPPTVIDTPFAPDQLMTIQFEVPAAAAVDLWLDDVSFE